MREIAHLATRRRLDGTGRVAKRHERNHFVAIWDTEHLARGLVVEKTHHNAGEPEGVGRQGDVLTEDTEVEEEPVAELRYGLSLIHI